jgi:hypothetical protein
MGTIGSMRVLTVAEALPLWTAAYRMDRLVPFVGSGLSIPACRSWSALVVEALNLLGLTPDRAFATPPVPREIITRQADEAMRLLRAMPRHDFLTLFEKALYADRELLTPNSLALARIRWPLTITTNYDDVLLRAFDVARAVQTDVRPLVVGRSPSDCHMVLKALDVPSPPLLWAIQGFLHRRVGRDNDDLVAQLVLSHKQYQDAINNAPLFRRAFGEVFRRRTLLFVGSGILEDYLVNLFGEVVAQHGPPPRRHYALLREQQLASLDARFLSDRLGIVPVVFEDYAEIAQALNDLGAAVTTAGDENESPLRGTGYAALPASLGYQLVTPGGCPPLNVVVESARLRPEAPLPPGAPPPAVVTAISVGRVDGGLFAGPMARAVLGAGATEVLRSDFRRHRNAGPIYVSDRWPVLGVTCRDEVDVLDLGLIPAAIGDCMQVAAQRGARALRMGLLSSGTRSPWHPVFSLIQMLAGIRERYRVEHQDPAARTGLEEIRICLVDPRAWYPLVSGQIPVAELLSSSLNTVFVDLETDGGSDLFTHVVPHEESCLETVQRYFNLDSDHWQVELSPAHSDMPGELPAHRPLTSYTTVRIRYRVRQGAAATRP